MFIAVVGCGHGEVDKIYEVVAGIEEKRGIKVSLVLCCGDFQTVRNMTDLRCMACPIKYQKMHDFYRYYSGEKEVPITTLFIGGNHEASNYLQELPYGGWVAPNMYFMGNSCVLRYGSVRIAGISGIFKGHDYRKGRYECPPYDADTMRSVYHYRNLDTFRLKQIKSHVDIVLSHDWPKGINNFGNSDLLIRQKPFFRQEIERDDLGSGPLFEVLTKVQPTYWFSAHLHVKFSAIVPHSFSPGDSEFRIADQESSIHQTPTKMTKFLALDKVLPRRQFLQIIEIPGDEAKGAQDFTLYYDPEWLAILKSTDHLVSSGRSTCYMPGPGYSSSRVDFIPTDPELREVESMFEGNLEVPSNFIQTAPPHIPGERPGKAFHITNDQTKDFCERLGITDPISLLFSNPHECLGGDSMNDSSEQSSLLNATYESSISQISSNPDEISLDDEGSGEENPIASSNRVESSPSSSVNSIPPRRKLMLPPAKSTEIQENPESNEAQLGLLDSIFNKSSGEEVQKLSGTEHLFMIDKVGEPNPKKRRNAAYFGPDN